MRGCSLLAWAIYHGRNWHYLPQQPLNTRRPSDGALKPLCIRDETVAVPIMVSLCAGNQSCSQFTKALAMSYSDVFLLYVFHLPALTFFWPPFPQWSLGLQWGDIDVSLRSTSSTATYSQQFDQLEVSALIGAHNKKFKRGRWT